MRFTLLFLAAVILAASVSYSADAPKFVQPKRNNVGLYKNETRSLNETAMREVGLNDRLRVLRASRDHYQVQTDDGVVGWIIKDAVASASGKSFLFDDAEVIGYLDNPTPVYIIDADSKDATPIKLDRSFAEALRENVDRETVERQGK